MSEPTLCDCGHEAVKTGCTAGYATLVYGDGREVTLCRLCSSLYDRGCMVRNGKSGLYLTKSETGRWIVTDWLGGLRFAVTWLRKSWHNMAGRDGRIDFRFIGPDGLVWAGRCIGDQEYCRVRRTKLRYAD